MKASQKLGQLQEKCSRFFRKYFTLYQYYIHTLSSDESIKSRLEAHARQTQHVRVELMIARCFSQKSRNNTPSPAAHDSTARLVTDCDGSATEAMKPRRQAFSALTSRVWEAWISTRHPQASTHRSIPYRTFTVKKNHQQAPDYCSLAATPLHCQHWPGCLCPLMADASQPTPMFPRSGGRESTHSRKELLSPRLRRHAHSID